MNRRNKIISCIVLSGIALTLYYLLVNYSDVQVDVLNSVWSYLLFTAAFNFCGFACIRICSWAKDKYALTVGSRRKFILFYIAVTILFLLLDYSVLVIAKMMAGVPSPFILQYSGIILLMIIWLLELMMMGLLMAYKFSQDTLELQKKAAKLQSENDLAHYKALQNQLNPHFLFNSLNTLISEITFNPKNAVEYTRKLSDVYRYVLQRQDKTMISLREELDFLNAYIFLHQVRIGDSIVLNLTIPQDCMEKQIPPLSLQLLFENMIKHNTVSPSQKMNVDIFVEDNYLTVKNSINRRQNCETSGIGLQNLSDRCRLMTGKNIEIDETEHTFTVKIPFENE